MSTFFIDPWRVQSDVFVVGNSRDIQKKKKKKEKQESKHAFKVLQMRTIEEKETRIKLLEDSYCGSPRTHFSAPLPPVSIWYW